MRRYLILLFVFAAALVRADAEYLGVFLNGAKVGYASSEEIPDTKHGAEVRIDNYNLLNLGLLGQDMKIEIKSSLWMAKNKPVRMETRVESNGRWQNLIAVFKPKTIELDNDNNGAKTKKTIDLPTDAPVVDDPITAILGSETKTGQSRAFYVLDPMTTALVKNTVTVLGKQQLDWKGQKIEVTAVEMAEPRATTTAYFSSKGDLVKVAGPMGIEMIPMPEAEAKAEGTGSAVPDIAEETAIVPDKPFNPLSLKSLKLKVVGRDLKSVPSDHRQTVAKSGEAWVITVTSETPNAKATIAGSAAQKPAWLASGQNIPADDESIVKLAKSIVGTEKLVIPAAERVRKYVLKIMRPNAGIGVLRDAREVLKSKEGVCRDYAVLTASLLRAAKIPARLASGLVYQSGQYYYHAWAEVWDGKNWIGVDSTRPESVGIGHIKLAQGSVEEAFTFPFLGKVKMEVLDARAKQSRT